MNKRKKSLGAAVPPSDTETRLQRTHGVAEIRFCRSAGKTRPYILYQEGACRIRLPRTHDAVPEAVLINTAGGLTGGDTLKTAVSLGPEASAIVTSQACEKIYRSAGGVAMIDTDLTVEAGAALCWMPQPTILFDKARLVRDTTVTLAEESRLLAVEAVILGRAAMGETVTEGLLRDSWRVRRGGRMIYADALSVEGPIAEMAAEPPLLGGASAVAMVLLVGRDAEDRIGAVRDCLEGCESSAGASAWDGLLVVRLVAATGETMIGDLVRILTMLRALPMPRVWMC